MYNIYLIQVQLVIFVHEKAESGVKFLNGFLAHNLECKLNLDLMTLPLQIHVKFKMIHKVPHNKH